MWRDKLWGLIIGGVALVTVVGSGEAAETITDVVKPQEAKHGPLDRDGRVPPDEIEDLGGDLVRQRPAALDLAPVERENRGPSARRGAACAIRRVRIPQRQAAFRAGAATARDGIRPALGSPTRLHGRTGPHAPRAVARD